MISTHLTQTAIDDLVEFLDLSLDEAEVILNAAKDVVAMRDRTLQGGGETETAGESTKLRPKRKLKMQSAEEPASRRCLMPMPWIRPTPVMTKQSKTVCPSALRPRYSPRSQPIRSRLSEAEPITEDELVLQEAGRDLRPDTIVPAPDITAAELAAIESLEEFSPEANSLPKKPLKTPRKNHKLLLPQFWKMPHQARAVTREAGCFPRCGKLDSARSPVVRLFVLLASLPLVRVALLRHASSGKEPESLTT